MDRKKIIFGSGILTFIIGFILISFATITLLLFSGRDVFEPTHEFILVMGLFSFLGLALVAIGVIVILLIKFIK